MLHWIWEQKKINLLQKQITLAIVLVLAESLLYIFKAFFHSLYKDTLSFHFLFLLKKQSKEAYFPTEDSFPVYSIRSMFVYWPTVI